ncbi:MAG: hypothetical protein R2793_08145 [Flavobacteriaceae bacterium]
MKHYHYTKNVRILFFLALFLGTYQMSVAQLTSNKPVAKRGQTMTATTPQVPLKERIKTQSNEYVITGRHTSSVSGIEHIYLRQAINGIEVAGTDSSIHLDTNGNVISSHDRFITNRSYPNQKQ